MYNMGRKRDKGFPCKMKKFEILHVIGLRSEMTGSGIYLEAIIRESHRLGFSNDKISGVPFKNID